MSKALPERALFTLILVRDMHSIPQMETMLGKSRLIVQRNLSYLFRDGLIEKELWPGSSHTRRYVITRKGREVLSGYKISPDPAPGAISRHDQVRRDRAELEVRRRALKEAKRALEESIARNDTRVVAEGRQETVVTPEYSHGATG